MFTSKAWRDRRKIITNACQRGGKAYIAAQNPQNAHQMNPFATNIIVVDGIDSSNNRIDTSAAAELVMPVTAQCNHHGVFAVLFRTQLYCNIW